MTKRLKKFTAMILAGLLACFSLTACSDEVEVKPDEPMGPSQIQNALKNASDYTVVITIGDGYNWTLKKDGSIVWHIHSDNAGRGTYYDASTNTVYKDSESGYSSATLVGLDTPQLYAYEEIAKRIDNIVQIFNDGNYTSTGNGSYTMTAAGLAAIGEDSVTITSSGMIYTIKIDFETITIDFSDTVLTLPPVA